MSGDRRPDREEGAAPNDSTDKVTPFQHLVDGTVGTDSESATAEQGGDELRFPDLLRWYRDSNVDERRYAMRKVIAVDPAVAVEMLMPAYHPTVQQGIVKALTEHRVREGLDELLNPTRHQPKPELVTLTSFLQEPDDPVRYRVDGLWPREGRIVLAAQNKSGKTTLTGNLMRSLVDGDAFLEAFDVEPAERVVLIDNEMSPSQIRRWLRDQGIRKTDAVDVVCLRGRVSSFNILDPATRAEWAERIGPADVLIFDVLRPALDALGLSEDKESGRFLEALDELCHAADIPELVLVHHMGHSNERSRGDSRLEDWPDAKWRLVREDHEDATSPRYFSAFGRDVDQPEVRLGFDPDTRHLRVDGGSRSQARAGEVENAVQLWVMDNPGSSQNAIETGVGGDRNHTRKAIKALVADGWIKVQKEGQKHAHYAVENKGEDK